MSAQTPSSTTSRRCSRFPLDTPEKRELVWDTTLVSMEGFEVSPDGRHAGGMFPWPGAGIADLKNKTWRKFGEGCFTSMTRVRGPLFWYFDGAHRNVTMVDAEAGTKWMVNLNGAPGFDGAEVSHPRWTNHPRFLAITGLTTREATTSRVREENRPRCTSAASPRTFQTVEGWLRVTNNGGGDADPDVWIDLDNSKYPDGRRDGLGRPPLRALRLRPARVRTRPGAWS